MGITGFGRPRFPDQGHTLSHMALTQAPSSPLAWLAAYISIKRYLLTVYKEHSLGRQRDCYSRREPSTSIYAVRLARARGWTVLAFYSGRNSDFARERGADEVIDYTTSPETVKLSFKPDFIVGCVGGTEWYQPSLERSDRRG
ncbi:hypothetical protein F5X96DRAFT_651429 [Biscogniauxia mediterranea]|nr:hypothetical protein F5X96DRAFT_651429 [Biscogniauxia mediterranea]